MTAYTEFRCGVQCLSPLRNKASHRRNVDQETAFGFAAEDCLRCVLHAGKYAFARFTLPFFDFIPESGSEIAR